MTVASHGFNAINRGVYISDNLPFLRSLNDECVDLVCIDPPFAKNETFVGDRLKPPLTEQERDIESRLLAKWRVSNADEASAAGLVWPESSARGGYKDIWSWEDDVHEDWLTDIERDYENISKLIDAARYVHSDSVAAYLCYIAIRLLEIHRILKPTGSLYLHCDHTANGYLRQLLDGVFGRDNFQNEIVWGYRKWTNAATNFQSNHDTIFYYAKSKGSHTFNKLFDYDAPQKVIYRRGWDTCVVEGGIRQLIVYDRNKAQSKITDGNYDRIVYREEQTKVALPDHWNIPILNSQAKERTGYPTQKPVALAERIISASTNPGDVVLDCFAGCAYAGVAAERLGRQWVACDFNPRTWTVFKRQFSKPELVLLTCNDQTTGQQVLGDQPTVTVHGPMELPARTSPVSEVQVKDFQLNERKFKVPASIIPERDMLTKLLELSSYTAWCCGFANRRPNGTVVKTVNNFHLDHIDPKSKNGSNQITNRAPLCPTHNVRKNNRRVHLADYREEIADAGEMLVDTTADLINLAYAHEQALAMYGQAYAARNATIPNA